MLILIELIIKTLYSVSGQAMDAFFFTGIVGLVLEEDGTMLDTDEFFETIEDGSVIMVLEQGQKWNPKKVPVYLNLCSLY